MAQSSPEFSNNDDSTPADEFQTNRGCCSMFNFPCFNSHKSDWERISASDLEQQENGGKSWWNKGVKVVKKVREWSELVAGPKWKTFIRRFNRTGGKHKAGKFQYDPMSYALNFDEGQNDQAEEDRFFRDFSSRYAAIPGQIGQPKDTT